MALRVGDMAPDFELTAVTGDKIHRVRLGDYKGQKHVVVAFHPINWTPVWASQVPAFNDALDKFAGLDAQVLGVSIDSIPSHIAWQRREIGMMSFPLLSDLYPHGEVARKFDIFREGPPVPGINERAVFIVDKNGKVVFRKVYPLDQVPSVQECLDVLGSINQPATAGR